MTPFTTRYQGLLGLLAVTLAVMLCTSVLVITVNAQCQSTFDNHTPLYPGATVIREEYNFLGRKMMVLHTPDSPYDVDIWYRRTYALAVQADVKHQTRTAWRGLWTVEPSADQPGSLIKLTVPCGQY